MAAQQVSYNFAKQHRVLLGDEGRICFENGASLLAITELQRHLAAPEINYLRLSRDDFAELLQKTFEQRADETAQIAGDLENLDLDHLVEALSDSEDLLSQDQDAPVVRLINALLHQAVQKEVSDVHFETYESRMVVRFRIDGVLQDILEPRRAIAPVLTSRLKVMAKLDIAEKRVPQDGRISLALGQTRVDVRVSTMPSNHGERVVLRLLYKSADKFDYRQLGMSETCRSVFSRALTKPHGIILVTGPTGSGKSTTLYAGLNAIKDGKKNLLTIEDPIEYDLEGVGQTQVNNATGMTFAKGLRAILRQDPDVVMVGEIRDAETAKIAIQASLTGHLVLSTLHTNSAVGAISRLTDMGVEPFLLSSSLSALVAQRLVRLLCEHCKQPYSVDHATSERFGIEPDARLYHAVGCPECRHQGYRGRTGVYEIIEVTSEIQELIHSQASESDIQKAAKKQGASLFDDGKRYLLSGQTTVEELLRVTREVES